MIPLLYSDDDILIIDKPAGLAVQPGEGVRICVLDAVERFWAQGLVFMGLVAYLWRHDSPPV